MSLSRQILSSPFDAPQRPRTAASRQNGDRKRVKEGGSTLANYSQDGANGGNHFFVDARVVRRSTFNPHKNSPISAADQKRANQPGCILFDSRLINGHVFANPIVTVRTEKEEERTRSETRNKKICTPPPVKGRHHVSVQTEGVGGVKLTADVGSLYEGQTANVNA